MYSAVMKRKILITSLLLFALAVSLLGPVVAFAADAGSCYVISDSDQRQFCLAKARRESGQCYAIQNAGLRAQCLAEVRR